MWQSFPERMVGFLTWNHFWNEAQGVWDYSTELANEFSMALTTAAFYHRCNLWPQHREKGPEAPVPTQEWVGGCLLSGVKAQGLDKPLPSDVIWGLLLFELGWEASSVGQSTWVACAKPWIPFPILTKSGHVGTQL